MIIPLSPVKRLMAFAEARMRQAEEVEDLDTWVKHYKIWIELVPLAIREPFYKAVSEESGNELPDRNLPFFHPAVG